MARVNDLERRNAGVYQICITEPQFAASYADFKRPHGHIQICITEPQTAAAYADFTRLLGHIESPPPTRA